MDNIYKYILESIPTGKIDKQVAVKLISDLKQLKVVRDREDDIAIIGMAVNFPMASSIEKLWQNISNGVCAVSELPESRKKDMEDFFSIYDSYDEGGGKSFVGYQKGAYLDEIDKFDYNFFKISPKEASLMDPAHRLFLQTAWNAIEDAGYGGNKIKGSETGVYIGYSNDFGERYKTYIRVISPSDIGISISGNINSIIAGRVSYLLDLKGPSILFDTACSSSLVAVYAACRAIKDGECSMAIAGGVKLNLLPVINKYKENVGIESKASMIKTFDDNSDGTVFGEGVAVVLLKSLQKALEDNDHIYAVIKATAINQDGNSIGITAPNPEAQCDVILKAWKDAGINPEDISYIEAHGTGTKLGDPIEISGIESAFKKYTTKKQFCAVGSIKTNFGHLDNAAGIAGLIKAVLALYHKQIPPILHFDRPNRKISFETSPVYVNDKLTNWICANNSKRICGVSSFGLSGTNCHVILEEALSPDNNHLHRDDRKWVVTISADNMNSLREILDRYDKFLKEAPVPDIQNISYTANTGRWHLGIRAAILARNVEELKTCIEALRNGNIDYKSIKGVFVENGILKKVESNNEEKIMSDYNAAEIGLSIQQKIERIHQFDSVQHNIFMEDLCEAYIKGLDIRWEALYENKRFRKVRLPLYPFQRTRCWVESEGSNKLQQQAAPKQSVILTGRESGEYSYLEKQIAGVWSKVLGIEKIDMKNNFFELGGNSIMALNFEVEMEKSGIKVSYSELYRYPTFNELCSYIFDNGFYINTSRHSGEKVKILGGIRPFDNLIFKGCFYNAFFPVMGHFNRSYLPFLANDIITYKNFKEKGLPLVITDYISCREFNEILNEEGICMDCIIQSDNLIEDIELSISSQHPVILSIDCFYEPLRRDTFMKDHWPHNILVYGYGSIKKEFYVLEHRHKDSLRYGQQVIQYKDLENCYKGYLTNFKDLDSINSNYNRLVYDNMGEHNTFYSFRVAKDNNSNDLSQENSKIKAENDFLQNLSTNKELIYSGQAILINFCSTLKDIVSDEIILTSVLDELVDSINNIVNAKKVEAYRLSKLFPGKLETISILNDMIELWDSIRAHIVKYQLLPECNINVLVDISKYIDKLRGLEEAYVDMLYKILPYAGRIKNV